MLPLGSREKAVWKVLKKLYMPQLKKWLLQQFTGEEQEEEEGDDMDQVKLDVLVLIVKNTCNKGTVFLHPSRKVLETSNQVVKKGEMHA